MSRQFSISVRVSENGKQIYFGQDEDLISRGSGYEARLWLVNVENQLGIETAQRFEIEKMLGRRFKNNEPIAFMASIDVTPEYEKAGAAEALLDAMMREAVYGGSSVLIAQPIQAPPKALEWEYRKYKKYIEFLSASGFTLSGGFGYYVKVLERPVVSNPFLAQPTTHRGGTMSGVLSHPGFHTGASMTICQPYAQAKVRDFLPSSWGKELQRHVMRDYPVILELDMQGMPFTIDFDAANWFNDAVQQAISESDDFDALVSYLDFSDTEEEMPDTMLEALFYLSGANPNRAVYSLRDWLEAQPDPEEAFAKIKRDGLPDELLAKVSGQFRYMDDVPSGRIVTIHYIRPVFDNLFPHYEDPDWHHDRIVERIEALGYDTVTKENVYDGSEVLSVIRTVDVGPKLFPVENQRIEFHGTSWRNLLSAAPELKDALPLPPKPFWGYDPDSDDEEDDDVEAQT